MTWLHIAWSFMAVAGALMVACALSLLSPRVPRALLVSSWVLWAIWAVPALHRSAPGELLLTMILLGLSCWAFDWFVGGLRASRNPPSPIAPGGAPAPGEAGERDGERYAPMPDVLPVQTAGRAGRPCAFSGGAP